MTACNQIILKNKGPILANWSISSFRYSAHCSYAALRSSLVQISEVHVRLCAPFLRPTKTHVMQTALYKMIAYAMLKQILSSLCIKMAAILWQNMVQWCHFFRQVMIIFSQGYVVHSSLSSLSSGQSLCSLREWASCLCITKNVLSKEWPPLFCCCIVYGSILRLSSHAYTVDIRSMS